MRRRIKSHRNYNDDKYYINTTHIYWGITKADGTRELVEYDGVEHVEYTPSQVNGVVPAGGKNRHVLTGPITGGSGKIRVVSYTDEMKVDFGPYEISSRGFVVASPNPIDKNTSLSFVKKAVDGSEEFVGFPSVVFGTPTYSKTGTNVGGFSPDYIEIPFNYTMGDTGLVEVSKEGISDEEKIDFIKKVHGIDVDYELEITIEEIIETEPIRYITVYEDDPELEIGMEEVVEYGQDGLRELVYTVTYHDGIEKKRELKYNNIKIHPKSEVIRRGTKANSTLYGEQTGIEWIETELSIVQQYTEGILWRLNYIDSSEYLSTVDVILDTETEDWDWYLEQVVDLLVENESRHDNPYNSSLSSHYVPYHEGTPEQVRYHFTNILTRLESVTPEQVDQFNQESEGIEYVRDIDNIFQDVLVDAIAAKGGIIISKPNELDQEKGYALSQLEYMDDLLTQEEINNYTARLIAAETIEDVNTILYEAQDLYNGLYSLIRDKDNAIRQINNDYEYLSDYQKAAYIIIIEGIRDYSDIYSTLYEVRYLDEAIETALIQLEEFTNLTVEQRDDFIEQIGNALESNEVVMIVFEAETLNEV